MQRGEIWWADLPPPMQRHPVVLVSRNAPLDGRDMVLVALITARIRETQAEVPLGSEDGLPKTVINTGMLSTVPAKHLVSRIALLSPRKLAQLDNALRYVLGLPSGSSERPHLPVKQRRLFFGGSSLTREPAR
jgi:mRNA interferase MazF